MKLLYYGENPYNPTGFGNMNKQLLKYLAQTGIEIICIATSVVAWQLPERNSDYPYEIVPCKEEPGVPLDQRNLKNAYEYLCNGDCDIFFYQGDFGANDDIFTMLLEAREKRPELLSIAYCPLDCDILNPYTFSYLSMVDAPVVYTHHARRVAEKYRPELAGKISVVWPGCEPDVFYPLSQEERRQARKDIFSIEDDSFFLALNVNRNQPRKDLARCMAIWHEFHQHEHWSSLYMHSVKQDIGGNLPLMADTIGVDIESGEILFSPDNFTLQTPCTREELNRIYNAADCFFSVATGEGWGLGTTEAMAAGLPVIVPANTANLDILGEDSERGWGIYTGGDIDHQIWHYGISNNPRDIVHASSALEKLEYVVEYPELARYKADKALQWAREHTWDNQGKIWQDLIKALMAHREVSHD